MISVMAMKRIMDEWVSCVGAVAFVALAIGCGGGSSHPADASMRDVSASDASADSASDAPVDSASDAPVDSARGSDRDITDFEFLAANNPGLTTDATSTLTYSPTSVSSLRVALPTGTDVTAFVATFTTTGANVSVGTTVQVSGVTANNFTGPVTYTVTAGDGSTRTYVVTVTTPTFAAAGDFATGQSPRYTAVGDFNADGKPDLAVPNLNSGTVSILLDTTATGATAATFAAKVDLATNAGPTAAAIADLDGDGKPDLAVTNYNSNTVSVFINTTATAATTPTFANPVNFTTGTGPFAIAIADLNGDGKADLIVTVPGPQAAPTDTISVLLNTTTTTGVPSFAAKSDFTVGMIPTSVTSADFNGDGKPDLAIGFYSLPQVSVLLNTTAAHAATPSFATQVDLAMGGYSFLVASGDLNGDGRPDLAATTEDQAISIFVDTTPTNGAVATFAGPTYYFTRYYSFHVAIGNLDGDQRPDVAVVGDGDGLQVLDNRTASSSALNLLATVEFPTVAPSASSIADFNGDGKPDLAITNGAGVQIMLAR
jgi:hypothetical protein